VLRAVLAVCAAVATSTGAARTLQVGVVASGLEHPMGISFASDGSL
jgi:hypothetical protein